MSNSIGKYREDIDFLKGFSIVAVVLYHAGYLSSGWLGVDIFFVINGYLVLPRMIRNIAEGRFGYFLFLRKRVVRLWPLVILASALSIVAGFFLMLPNDYENLAESVVASNIFANNILALITTKNYWAIGNDFAPLMHTWYLGILVQFYVLIPLLLLFFKWVFRTRSDIENLLWKLSFLITLLSFALFLTPRFSASSKFYLLPFRFWEIAFGGGLYYWEINKKRHYALLDNSIVKGAGLIVIISVLVIGLYLLKMPRIVAVGDSSYLKENSLLKAVLMCVAIISVGIFLISKAKCIIWDKTSVLSTLGKMSYSIYIWHQVILAFYRYSVTSSFDILDIFFLLLLLSLFSFLSYFFIEKRVNDSMKSFLYSGCLSLLVCLVALGIYAKAGIMRDIPEMELSVHSVQRGAHAAYCDRIYSYDLPFPDSNGKINVIVEGVSYGRDFANILLESDYANHINLSYVYRFGKADQTELISRLSKADVIFSFQEKSKIPKVVWDYISPDCRVFGIGTKRFGFCNGQIYSKRYRTDYHNLTTPMIPEYARLNEEWKKSWGDNYVDMIAPTIMTDGSIRVFTEDAKYIAPDCEHLSPAGARWYAHNIDLESLLLTENHYH